MIDCEVNLKKLFMKYELEEFDPIGQPFNPNTQESMKTIPIPSDKHELKDTVA